MTLINVEVTPELRALLTDAGRLLGMTSEQVAAEILSSAIRREYAKLASKSTAVPRGERAGGFVHG